MENNAQRKKQFPWMSTIIVILIVVLMVALLMPSNQSKKIEETDFQTYLNEGQVERVYVYGGTVKGLYTTESGKSTVSVENREKFPNSFDFYFTVSTSGGVDAIRNYVNEYNNAHASEESFVKVTFTSEAQGESWLSQILPFIYIGLIILMAVLIFRSLGRINGKNMDFGKNKARMESDLKVRFDDVAGCDEEKQEMQEVVEFLRNPKKFTDLGARIPKGVLLVGPPGTGKTLLGKAIAGEAGVPFYSITGSDFVEMFVGVGAARVRDLFDTAKRNAPCLIFIDEIDAVGRQRGAGLGNTNDEREQTLNQLLVQMDGFETTEGIVVLAATNRPDVLDPALLRAGRFDRRIVVNPPDAKAREKILKLYAKNKPMAENIDYEKISKVLYGETGASIENVLNEAAILAARDGRSLITQDDIMEGISKVAMGPKKVSRKLSKKDKEATAYHEAGHAIIAKTVETFKNDVQEVTIIPRGMALGVTFHVPLEESNSISREYLYNYIELALGGWAAEQVVYGYHTAGVSNDIKEATAMARRMVVEFGMSDKIGPVYCAGDGEVFLGRDYQTHSASSERTASIIDDEIKAIMEKCLQRAVKRIEKHRDILEEMMKVLVEKETIYADEVALLMQGKTAETVIKHMDKKAKEREEADTKAREDKKKKELEKEKLEEEKVRLLREKAMAAFNGDDIKNQNADNVFEKTEKTVISDETSKNSLTNKKATEKANDAKKLDVEAENEKTKTSEKTIIESEQKTKEKKAVTKKAKSATTEAKSTTADAKKVDTKQGKTKSVSDNKTPLSNDANSDEIKEDNSLNKSQTDKGENK